MGWRIREYSDDAAVQTATAPSVNSGSSHGTAATAAAQRQRPVPDAAQPLHAALEASFDGRQGILSAWDDIEDLVLELSQSSDPALRRYTLFFRMWRSGCELDAPDPFGADFKTLSAEACAVQPDGYLDPMTEIMIAQIHSDGWLERGYYRRSAKALAAALPWTASVAAGSEVRASIVASLGSVSTIGGYVAEGLGCITRVAAPAIDYCTQSFIGSGTNLRQERNVIVELADVDEHTRNYRRAVAGFQLATSLLSPVELPSRFMITLALARCMARVGQAELAAEVLADVDELPPGAEMLKLTKFARTRVNVAAGLGRQTEALELCEQALTDELREVHLGLLSEVLLDGTVIARQLDEPRWILEHAGGLALHNDDGVGLLATLLYEDLAWAYRRVGDTINARRYLRLAYQGRSRFSARSPWSPIEAGAAPGVLLSARESHKRATRASKAERLSLERGIGSVTHDIRNQLQSLQLLSNGAVWNRNQIQTVGSIVTGIDDMLSDLLHDVEPDREIALTDVSLTAVVETVLARFRSSAVHKRIKLTNHLKGPILCRSDQVALDRIVSNLISNAIKYSPIGGSVEVTATALGSSFIDLHIIDSGPGIPRDEVADLFRWGGTLSSEPTGSEPQHGIGLFTAERLARLTGTSIRPHLRNGIQPSTMSMRVPLSRH